MSKFEHSDTELFLHLSDISISDSQTKKKKKHKKKKSSKKHLVECHRCCESFRTTEKSDRYTCQSCQSKPALIVLPLKKNILPNLSSLSIQEDEEDICPVCDTDCTCGTSTIVDPVMKPPKDNVVERVGATKKKLKKKKKEKIVTNIIQKRQEEDEDEEVVIDDLDDLLDTMSPLSDQVSENESIQLFTDESEPVDSGDDENIKTAETQAIIDELTFETTDSSGDEIMYIEDDDDDDESEGNVDHDENELEEEDTDRYTRLNHWSTTDDDEEEEEEEEDGFSLLGQEVSFTAENSNEYDNIVSAFMHALAPNDPGGAESNGANTPIAGEGEQLSAFELANALSLLTAFESENQTDILRRPSLPSSTVSAAQRHRGSQDYSSEALRTLSTIITDDLSLSYDTNHASSSSNSSQIDTPSSVNIQEQISGFLKQSSAAAENKKRLSKIQATDNNKKRKVSLSIEPTEEVSMDDLLDISQLHSDEENNDQEHPYSRDLSRWQRIPIGAFRLMRSKNKLWLER